MRKNNAEIMAEEHWAVIANVTTHHEGDQRSRDAPGHGYPAHSTTAMEYYPFDNVEEALEKYKRSGTGAKIIKALPQRIITETKVVKDW